MLKCYKVCKNNVLKVHMFFFNTVELRSADTHSIQIPIKWTASFVLTLKNVIYFL